MEDLTKVINESTRKKRKVDYSYHMIKWIVFAIFVIYSLSLIVPFVFMLINSFKSQEEFILGNVFNFPKQWYGLNFIEILTYQIDGQTVWEMILNSIILTTLGTFINVFLSAVAAYCLAKYKFPGRNLIYGLAIFTMVVPIVGTLPSQVVMMETFHIDDSLFGVLFLYSGCFGFNFILLYSSFTSISNSYMEAASIDGASRFKTFFTIMLPMAKGPLVACSILQAIVYWNDYSTPLLFMPSRLTLAVGLQRLQEEIGGSGNYPLVFASMIIAILPILILYLVFQKRIIASTNAGGLKG